MSSGRVGTGSAGLFIGEPQNVSLRRELMAASPSKDPRAVRSVLPGEKENGMGSIDIDAVATEAASSWRRGFDFSASSSRAGYEKKSGSSSGLLAPLWRVPFTFTRPMALLRSTLPRKKSSCGKKIRYTCVSHNAMSTVHHAGVSYSQLTW